LYSALTCHTLICPSVNPEKSFLPKAFQVNEIHIGNFTALTFLSPSLFSVGGLSACKVAIGLVADDIKSQILTPYSVPAATHYNLGLNEIWKIVDPASKSLEGWDKSLISQIYNFLSLPPVAMYFPLGEIETPLILESWALNVFLT